MAGLLPHQGAENGASCVLTGIDTLQPSIASQHWYTGAQPAPDPDVVPSYVRQCSLHIGSTIEVNSTDHMSELAGLELPPDLHAAVPKRQRQFLAGRYCAARALEALGCYSGGQSLRRGPGGAPVWPSGFTGSITHTDEFVWAAVARTADVSSIGIDTEHIIAPARAATVFNGIAWPSETAHARAAGLDRLEALTLVFSAKEAIYKCISRKVGRAIGFHDVRITGVDAASRTFHARTVIPLSPEIPADTPLQGVFGVTAPLVHTAILLPPPPPGFGSHAR